MFKIFYNRLLDVIFPYVCVCGKTKNTHTCTACSDSITIDTYTIFETTASKFGTGHALLGVLAPCTYPKNPCLQEALHRFKYRYIQKLADPLAQLLQKRITPFLRDNPRLWHIIPLPLHTRKYLERGFNQNDLLAEACFQDMPMVTLLYKKLNPLKRTRYTISQTSLSREERVTNMKSAFSVTDPSTVYGKSIILIDDVVTTGSTLVEAARVLSNAGAREVWALVLAID